MRLDKWLWQARYFKTRSLAAGVITGNHVLLNGTRVSKPAQAVKVGDTLSFAQARRLRVVRIDALPTRRGPAAEAQALYTDNSPPEIRDDSAPVPRQGRPDKKDRRAGRLSKEGRLE